MMISTPDESALALAAVPEEMDASAMPSGLRECVMVNAPESEYT